MKKIFSLFVSAGLLVCGLAAGAQTDNSEAWRKNPPQLPPPAPFKMPSVTHYKLANGLSVKLVEDHRVPFTTLSLGMKTGSAADPADQRGLAQLTAEMITEGTATKKSKQIAEEIDFAGGALSAGAGADFTIVSASALSQYNDRLFQTVSDVLLNPSFPEDELALEKTNVIEVLKSKRGKPEFLAEEKFAEVVYGEHPYSAVAPKPEVVEKITRSDLVNFHKAHYLPNISALVVVGDFKTDQMKALIEKSFGGWKQDSYKGLNAAAAKEQKGRKIYLVHRPGSVQSSVKIGNLGIARNDPDYYTASVANQILGGAAVSRLFVNLREHKGYTYGAYSDFSARAQRGHFNARADVRTEVTGPALKEFFGELERIRKEAPAEKELLTAKNYLVGSFQLGLETQGGLAQRLIEGELYNLPADYLETYADKIMAVKPEDVQKVSQRLIDADNLVVTVVGDAEKVKGDLSAFAPVSVFDTNGKAINVDVKEVKKESPGSKTAGDS